MSTASMSAADFKALTARTGSGKGKTTASAPESPTAKQLTAHRSLVRPGIRVEVAGKDSLHQQQFHGYFRMVVTGPAADLPAVVAALESLSPNPTSI